MSYAIDFGLGVFLIRKDKRDFVMVNTLTKSQEEKDDS